MDNNRFDTLARILATTPTRRRSLGLLAGVGLGGLSTLLGSPHGEVGEAGKRNRKQKRKRERRRNRNQPQTPQSPPPEPCADGTKVCAGTCIPTGNCCTDTDCPGTQVCRAGACGLPTLYPNLQTLPVSDLHFDQHPTKPATSILRFANTVWNAGEGRLELESDSDSPDVPQPIYQNLYDAPVGGNRTERKRVASDFIYHPNHDHFHFADFAEYLLLGKDATGAYRPMKTEGIKTSFCIMDSDPVSGSYSSQYNTCSADRQGLTPGWADTYGASLYDQWIELGDRILSDGEYAVQSIADPKGVLDEGGGVRETDNTAITYFTVAGGKIRDLRDSP